MNALAIKFEFEIPTIRRALAVITGKAFSDSEIEEMFIHTPPVLVHTEKALEGESLQMCIAFLATLIAHKYPELLVKDKDKN